LASPSGELTVKNPNKLNTIDAGLVTQQPSIGNAKLASRKWPGYAPFSVFNPVLPGSCPSSCPKMNLGRAAAHKNVKRTGEGFRNGVRLAALSRPDLRMWGYTHFWRHPGMLEYRDSLPENVSIVASVETPEELNEAESLGWALAAIAVPSTTGYIEADEVRALREAAKSPTPRGLVLCPAQRPNPRAGCADCLLCARQPRKFTVIGFAGHGVGKTSKQLDGGCCYAQQGNVRLHELRAGRTQTDFLKTLSSLPPNALVRLVVSGDFGPFNTPNQEN
jgi:hypothetical protein